MDGNRQTIITFGASKFTATVTNITTCATNENENMDSEAISLTMNFDPRIAPIPVTLKAPWEVGISEIANIDVIDIEILDNEA